MGINIEFNTDDITAPELDALAALIAVLAGRKPGGDSLLKMAGIGTDADRPSAPQPDPQPEVAVVAPPPPSAEAERVAPPPPAANAAHNAAEALMQSESARVAAANVAPAGVDLDVNGLPWDGRIHASTKTKNADQSWRNKRGVHENILAEVTAELKAIMAAPVPEGPVALDPAAAFGGAAPAPLPTTDADAANTASVAQGADVASDTRPLHERMAEKMNAEAVVPPPPAAEAAAPTPPAPDMTDFARIMRTVAAKQTAGTLSTEMTTALCVQLGLTGVRDLASRPDLIPAFEALLP